VILGVNHVQITVPKDSEDAAREFYCAFLGMKEIAKPDSLRRRGGFWLQAGNFQVHVGTEDGIERERSKAHVAYLVDDVERWRERLGDCGIKVIDGTPIPGYHRFEFRDPFGNRVEFLSSR
jgi:catechol 2,3-dioxygenase-like lactoylglutathione lyase family enzyme